jgi:hypothetical protein
MLGCTFVDRTAEKLISINSFLSHFRAAAFGPISFAGLGRTRSRMPIQTDQRVVWMYVCMNICKYACMKVCMIAHTWECTCTYVYMNMYLCMYAHVPMNVCTCTYVCMHILNGCTYFVYVFMRTGEWVRAIVNAILDAQHYSESQLLVIQLLICNIDKVRK